ncbi:MAG: DUF1566 domain-containing protein [Coriobacteriia bacterium]|nr:DUF1566 domain-containing protein [Coriobacteriia bacterium]
MKRLARSRPAILLVTGALGLSMVSGCTSGASTDTSTETQTETVLSAGSYAIVDTGQTATYDASTEISAPAEGDAFYGQDAQYDGNAPSYTDNGDGTITDNVTGLVWTQSPDLDGDGDIDVDDKLTYEEAMASAADVSVGGYDDWRLPTIDELYSLIDFSGEDPSGVTGNDTSGLTPFIDTDYFEFDYGDTDAGERIIDAQMATSTLYVDTTMNGSTTMFGVNFADGRIKGYGLEGKPAGATPPEGVTPPAGVTPPEGVDAAAPSAALSSGKTFYVYYVRGNTSYGINDFSDNGDGTVTDSATELMWAQDDSGESMDWEEALAWAEQANADAYLGYSDWRVPNVKELQGIVDYTRSPGTTDSAAIDPIFSTTEITNEAGESDYGFYWSSTTHANSSSNKEGGAAAYVAFGRSLGYMDGEWMDVHGAGSQRSDPKAGDASEYPEGFGPQGDARRIDNLVRLVRDAS